jgi:hypothetical protein
LKLGLECLDVLPQVVILNAQLDDLARVDLARLLRLLNDMHGVRHLREFIPDGEELRLGKDFILRQPRELE